jgi:hypothetical protein
MGATIPGSSIFPVRCQSPIIGCSAFISAGGGPYVMAAGAAGFVTRSKRPLHVVERRTIPIARSRLNA